MGEREVLISGAGVAGPLLAIRLARQGFRPTVVERAPALRDGGYKVDVRGAAVEVLKRTGVYGTARGHDTGMRQVTYVKPDGRPIAAVDANLLMGRRGDDIELMRGDLVRILHDAAAPTTSFIYGDSIAEIGPDGLVRFAGGSERRFDVIVGADGLHSNTRRLAGLDAPLRHLGAYLSICSVPNELRLDREEVFWAVPGLMIFLYGTGPDDPAKAGLVFASPELPRAEVTREQVAERFAGHGWEVPRLLESILATPAVTPAATPTPALGGSDSRGEVRQVDDFYVDALSQVVLPRWSAGRVVLLGDAAYCPSPASGMGTSEAIVGAYVLASALARHEAGGSADGRRAAAFAEYERVMRPYAEKNLALGKKMAGQMVPGGRTSIAMRNYAMRTLRFNPWKRQIIETVTKPIHQAAAAVELPATAA
jgi:2-polyprenyl-6-methoxyphenol hydroxylase-like FAD-dependent oxidoreductase